MSYVFGGSKSVVLLHLFVPEHAILSVLSWNCNENFFSALARERREQSVDFSRFVPGPHILERLRRLDPRKSGFI